MFTRALRSGLAVRFKAHGTSMLPSLWPGDVLTIQSADRDSMTPGDLVLAIRDDQIVIHRLVKIIGSPEDSRVILRGDAMPQDDPPMHISELLGKVSKIERKDRFLIPRRQVSSAARISGFLLCRWRGLRNFALRMYSIRTAAVSR